MPTPVTDGTYLYVIRDNGVLFCLDLKSGRTVYGPQRLRPATYTGSPVLADGKIYVTNEDGVTVVFRAGPKFELLVARHAIAKHCGVFRELARRFCPGRDIVAGGGVQGVQDIRAQGVVHHVGFQLIAQGRLRDDQRGLIARDPVHLQMGHGSDTQNEAESGDADDEYFAAKT